MAPVARPGLWRRWRSLPVEVVDGSMAPTLLAGDRLYVDPKAYSERGPSVGDLVVLRDPRGGRRPLIKRVAAVGPGRFQLGRRGVARVGGAQEDPADEGALETVELTVDGIVVLSEPGTAGRDSRHFGPVLRSAIEGRAWWRYAPRDRRGPL